MAEQATIRREVSSAYAIIGGIVSAGSLVSLVQKLFNVGLSPVLAEFVAYYRRVTHFFVDWLTFWLPFEVPGWYKDLYVISFLLCMLVVRSFARLNGTNERHEYLRAMPVFLLAAIVLSLPLLGLSAPLLMGLNSINIGGSQAEVDDQGIGLLFFKTLAASLIATVAFFALNSQM